MAYLKARDVTLDDLMANETGPPLSPRDVARISEWYVSEDRVWRDCRTGALRAKCIPTALRCRWRIAFVDAREYLKALTILDAA